MFNEVPPFPVLLQFIENEAAAAPDLAPPVSLGRLIAGVVSNQSVSLDQKNALTTGTHKEIVDVLPKVLDYLKQLYSEDPKKAKTSEKLEEMKEFRVLKLAQSRLLLNWVGVSTLLQGGTIDFNEEERTRIDFGTALLWYAAKAKNWELVGLLLKAYPHAKADLKPYDSSQSLEFKSVVDFAIDEQKWDIVKKILILNPAVKVNGEIPWPRGEDEPTFELYSFLAIRPGNRYQFGACKNKLLEIHTAFCDTWHECPKLSDQVLFALIQAHVPSLKDFPAKVALDYLKELDAENIVELQNKAKDHVVALSFREYRYKNSPLEQTWTTKQIKDVRTLIRNCLDKICGNEMLLRQKVRDQIVQNIAGLKVINRNSVEGAIKSAFVL